MAVKPAAKKATKATVAKQAVPKPATKRVARGAIPKKTASVSSSTARTKPSSSKKANAIVDSGPVLDLPEGVSEEIAPSQLLLDPQNLRLLERLGQSFRTLDVSLFGQQAIQQKLFELIDNDARFDIESLAASIANNGFLKHERLIVVRYDGNKFLVLEGNRRLTAVRRLTQLYGSQFEGLRNNVRESLRTLPCFVIDGPSVSKSAEQLNKYRRAAEIYIGMRHLMGAKNWEPASRYEFQSQLIFDEGWKIEEVAERFGRKKEEVLRDLKAQVLYQDFVKFEQENGIEHSLTYNAFAEAARAPVISKWLDWSATKMKYENSANEEAFFHYLISRLSRTSSFSDDSDDEGSPSMSAEMAVRRLRDMLKIEDESIEEALLDRDFKNAEILYEERKEGTLARKLATFTRSLKRTTSDDLNSPETKEKLEELLAQVQRMLKVIDALSGQ